MTQRIGVALSGGADSALAASLLLSQGHPIFGLHLLLTRTPEAEEQASRARDVAQRLHMELHVIDAADAFASMVISPFCEEYASGRTPNPCVTCNRDIKFGLLLRTALDLGADRLATGHYARLATDERGHMLQRAVDHQADQSYFLYAIEASVLEHLAFPLGEMPRRDVRTLAQQQGLVRGKSSQDICFIGGRNYHSFVAERVHAAPGDVVDLDGRVLGRHRGLPFFTVGQRHGLGVALGEPVYVVRLDAHSNKVIVGTAVQLMREAALLRQATWLRKPEGSKFHAQARVRYRARCSAAHVTLRDGVALVRFHDPQRSVAPGQSVVFYDGDTVLGGGVVAETYTRASDAE